MHHAGRGGRYRDGRGHAVDRRSLRLSAGVANVDYDVVVIGWGFGGSVAARAVEKG
jgi:hypothetical protein